METRKYLVLKDDGMTVRFPVRDVPTSPGWRFVLLVVIGAAVVRAAAIVVYPSGGADLEIYVYFGRLLLHGDNPYDAPAGGIIPPRYEDHPVGEFALFAAALGLHDASVSLRIVFVLADLASLLVLAFLFLRPVWWRRHLMLFLAFSPFVIFRWTIYAEDKTVLFLGLLFLIAMLERGRLAAAWMAATALGILKWLTPFFALPLTLFTAARRGVAWTAVAVTACAATIALTTIPFFPDSLDPYQRRQHRLALEPQHESLARFPDALGLWDPLVVKIFIPGALLAIAALFVFGRLDVREAVVLSFAASIVLLPESTRVEWIALAMLLITRLTTARIAVIWCASLVGFAAEVLHSDRFYGTLRDLPAGSSLTDLIGQNEGSLVYVLFANTLLFAVVAFYVSDCIRGRREVVDTTDLRGPSTRTQSGKDATRGGSPRSTVLKNAR